MAVACHAAEIWYNTDMKTMGTSRLEMVCGIAGATSPNDIELMRELIQQHDMLNADCDWAQLRRLWGDQEATDRQLEYLRCLGCDVGWRRLTKARASELIDCYVIVHTFRQAKAERQRRRDRLNATPPRTRTTRAAKMKWLYEFQELWNRILEDDVITADEAEDLKAWLNSHRTIDIMYDDFIKAIDAAVVDGRIDGSESEMLYQHAINTIDVLGGKAAELILEE